MAERPIAETAVLETGSTSSLPAWLQSARFRPENLARNLAHGAMLELRLTPKPGLVDLRSQGSHPDLSVVLMTRSASLLPAYFRELLEAERRGRGFAACMEAGRRAESRMLSAVGSNTHRGLIFLGGLLLLSSCREVDWREGHGMGDLRLNCSLLAEEFFRGGDLKGTGGPARRDESHGAEARRIHSIGGVRAEALAGLPAVFEVGLPAFVERLPGRDFVQASHYAMSRLMQIVEDTTAVHRCGPAGLSRIRQDGRLLQRVLEEEGDHLSLLEHWDTEYAEMGLTMGGVADCLSLTYALYLTAARTTETEAMDLHSLLLQRRHRRSQLPA